MNKDYFCVQLVVLISETGWNNASVMIGGALISSQIILLMDNDIATKPYQQRTIKTLFGSITKTLLHATRVTTDWEVAMCHASRPQPNQSCFQQIKAIITQI